MILPNVPESIAYDRVVDMLAEIGIPVRELSSDGVFIGWNTISCEVYAVNEAGDRYLDELTGVAAKHRVTIRLDHRPRTIHPAPRTIVLALNDQDGREHVDEYAIAGDVVIVTPRSLARARGRTVDDIVETPAFVAGLAGRAADHIRAEVAPCIAPRVAARP